MHGDVVEVRRLVEEEGADVNKATTTGPTPLATAAGAGRLSVVQYLVERGADKEKARATSYTPMQWAAAEGFLPVVQYLVEQGADKEKANTEGWTSMCIAVPDGARRRQGQGLQRRVDCPSLGGAE
jgi:hypothetical protein